MKYNIRKMDWAKRRPSDEKPTIIDVEVENLKPEHNHFCQMIVTYQNGDQQTLFSRVLYNEKTGKWSLDGMHVVLDIIEF
ncbi:hypothetical protein J7384_00810 [Endozoicomonas sp. G2_1]|uniref:hypothetical protein n=1 Tax=Endozoicomonas sp. G2_1 TaxID=2821091 RepID=UPI001AD9AD58|nr:hypothetical protein [Endozoicomonas sp. G2_1]MBO9488896.1 hypothetical protein [Endozoicomonas sp. G2_1]